MDTSETYIKMCDCDEIQEQRVKVEYIAKQMKQGDYYWTKCFQKVELADSQGATYTGQEIFGNIIWLPTQSQLQAMVKPEHVLSETVWYVCRLHEWILEQVRASYPPHIFTSMEQLWLAFVMKELHGKVWDGEKWAQQ